MVKRNVRLQKAIAADTQKLILTPRRRVGASINHQDDAEAAMEVCVECELPQRTLRSYSATVLHTHRRINAIVISVPKEQVTPLTRAMVRKGFGVELSRRVFPMLNDTVPALAVPKIWDAGYGGGSVRCAVLDTGIDREHPDFLERIVAFKNFSTEGSADRIGHGTHVAGIVCGAGSKFRGVAPDANLVVGKVLGQDGGDDTDVIAGLSWASKQGVQVMNLSLGGDGGPEDSLSRECNALVKEGFLICVAAGNSGPGRSTIHSPGSASGVITVGAVDKERSLTFYSARGPIPGKRYLKPDLLSYGGGVDQDSACFYKSGIVSTRSSGMRASLCDEPRLYTRMSGTSMATPHVTGIVSLLLDAVHRHAPEWDQKKKASLIKKILKESSVPLKDTTLSRWDTGLGLLEPSRAMELLRKKLSSV